jgi:hypothetical protein
MGNGKRRAEESDSKWLRSDVSVETEARCSFVRTARSDTCGSGQPETDRTVQKRVPDVSTGIQALFSMWD